jgi:hypothetical protein
MLTTLCKTTVATIGRTNPAISWAAFSRTMSTLNECRLKTLSRANSELLTHQIELLDTLLEHKHAGGANKVFTTKCPIADTTVGEQFRHSLDHLERVALDGLRIVRDNERPIDLHYDVRDREVCERDVFEARERASFIRDIFDGVSTKCERMDEEECSLDGKKKLNAYFTLPLDGREDIEFPLSSTLERELGFACHHAIHHNNIIRIIAAVGKTGLSMDDLPAGFGRAPSTLLLDTSDAAF